MKLTTARLQAFTVLATARLNGYSEEAEAQKDTFHRDGKAILAKLAKRAELTNVTVHSNKAGPAIGGEVYLESDEVFVQLSNACEYGILYRRGKDGPNRWALWSCLLDLDSFATLLRQIAKETYRRGP